MKHTFRKGQRVRSVYDPKHEFVIADSYKPERLFYEKGAGRWWTANELQAIGEAHKASMSPKLTGRGRHGRMHPFALRTLLAAPLAKATPKEPLPQKKCELESCGIIFTPKKKWQRFHGEQCNRMWHKQRKAAS